jgi:hypothetical protein
LRITVRHRFDFGGDRAVVGDDLVRPEAWDALRTQTTGAFAIASSREELEAQADARPEIGERTRQIDEWLRGRGVRTLASYGVGAAVVEAWLRRHDQSRRIVATDYGQDTLATLRRIFPEIDARRHDLRSDGPLEADLHLFHRIDTELSNRQFAQVLCRFAHVPILVVATEVHDLASAWNEVRKGLLPGSSRAGWARNRQAFEALWRRTHDAQPLSFHDLDAWVLEPRGASRGRP